MTLHGRPHVAPRPRAPEPVSWRVAGQPVEMQWQSFEATAPGGFGQLREARVMPRRGIRVEMWQGDMVIAHRPDGRVAYQGRLTAPPRYDDDVGIITAMGPRTVVDGFSKRLPYQIRGADSWDALDADPAHYPVVETWTAITKGNSIGQKTTVGEAVTNAANDRGGYYLFVDGYDVQRVAGTIRKAGVQNANQEMVINSASQLGGSTNEHTYILSDAANPDGTAFDLALTADLSPRDTVQLYWHYNTAYTPAATKRYWVDDLRVGVITDQDIFTSADVARDVAARCKYTVSATGPLNVLPLDWNGPATELLDYIAGLEDSTWMVLYSRTSYGKLIFRPFGHTQWNVNFSDGSVQDQGLEILPLYDAITTTYEHPAGMPQATRSTAADFGLTDPLPGFQSDYPDPIQLADVQPNTDMALAVNKRALKRLTQIRLQGTVVVRKTPRGQPFDILPGDTLKIGDFEPKQARNPQRIASVNYNFDGSVTLNLTRDLRLDSIIARLANRRIRRHHPRHRK